MWKVLIIILFLVASLLPTGVLADTTADIIVTAQGYVGVGIPGDLLLTYISDYELGVSWTKGADANMTLIRASYGRPLVNRTDGFEVYYGTGNSTTMWISNVGIVGPLYIGAWSQGIDGSWEETGTAEEGNFMSMSFLFGILVALGFGLLIASFRWKDMLLSYAAALTWMAIGFWWIVGDITNFGLEDPWVQILTFIPFILAFTVLLRLMNTEITMEKGGRKWTEMGGTPKGTTRSNEAYWAYKERMHKMFGGRR